MTQYNNLLKIETTYEELFSKLGLKQIEINKQVSCEEDIYVKTPDDKYVPILALIKKQKQKILKITTNKNKTFESSYHHLFIDGNSVPIKAIDADKIKTIFGVETIIQKETLPEEENVYDVSIETPHLYVGSNGIIHHNTFYVLQFIKEFLNTKKKGLVFLFESESAITKKMLQDRGIDVKRTVIIPVETVEEFRTQALKIINNYLKQKEEDRIPLFFALDSLGNLSTSKEMEDIATGNNKRDMTRAQLLRGAFRTLTLKLGKANVPLVCTNHVYGVISAYVPTNKQGGGEGLIYAASSIIELTKSKDREDDGSVSGAIIKASLTKGRITIENKKVETLLNYKTGLDRYYGLLPLAEKFGIFKKVSTRYEVADGVTAFENKILSEPERYFTKDVLDKIDEKCKDEFLYGVPDVVTRIDGDNIDD